MSVPGPVSINEPQGPRPVSPLPPTLVCPGLPGFQAPQPTRQALLTDVTRWPHRAGGRVSETPSCLCPELLGPGESTADPIPEA